MIKVSLNSGKNISDLYHFTRSADDFMLICSDHTLRAGYRKETGPAHEKKEDFISVTRDKNLPSDSGRGYRFGFILDGTKLTDNYKLEPMSYSQHQMGKKSNAVQLVSITRYENGICKAYLNQFGSITITRDTFDSLAEYIKKQPEERLDKAKLVRTENGTRKVSGIGAPIAEKYAFKTKRGIPINTADFPEFEDTFATISKNPRVNEREERVWKVKVDLGRCLKGVIIDTNLNDKELFYVKKGLSLLYEAGFAIKPSRHDIGFRPDKSKGNFIIERI